MKMYALYSVSDLPNLEFNHRKYCDIHNIEYNKIIISDCLSEKYLHILSCLQNNVEETLLFIDDLSFFKNLNYFPKTKKDIHIYQDNDFIIDNFFIIKSNKETIRIFHDIFQNICKEKLKNNNIKTQQQILFDKLKHLSTPYPSFDTEEKMYQNVIPVCHNNGFEINNCYILTFKHKDFIFSNPYFADSFCAQNIKDFEIPQEKYECFNADKKNALVLLYTPEIKEFGIYSEINIKKYCEYNNITLYVYRDLTEQLKELKVSGTWCKPWLLLENFDKHEYIGWIDSDILLSKDYKMNFFGDVSVYSDPSHYFNAGFMIYKTIEKNKKLLNDVIDSFKTINGELSGVYNHGGDQPRFIEKIKQFYPDNTPISNLYGNSHPIIPIKISPYKSNVMIHFMGYHKNFRKNIMKTYNSIMIKEYGD